MAHKKFAYAGSAKSVAKKIPSAISTEPVVKLKFCESHGVPLRRAELRARREQIQRDCAARRRKILRQSMPKEQRALLRQQERDQKFSFLEDDIEFQAGHYSTYAISAAAIAVAAGSAAIAINRFTRKFADKLDTLSDTTEVLLRSVTDTSEAVGDTFEGLNGFFGGVYKALNSFVEVVKSIGGAFWKLILGGFVIALRTCGAFGLVIQELVTGLLSKIVPDMSSVLEFDEDIQEQSCAMVSQLATMVACFVLPAATSHGSRSALCNQILMRVGTFDKVSSGFEGAFNAALGILQKCINVVLRMLGCEEVQLVGAAQSAVMKWCTEVDMKFKKIDMDKPSITDLVEARSLLGVGYNLKSTLQATYLRSIIERQLDRLNARIASHRGILETENCYRAPPVLVMFGGESAVGKTYLIKAFASAVLQLADLCKPEEVAQNMWQKGEDRFFNGYCGQLVYIMDDVFQKKSVKGSDECEGMTIIRAVNSWPFPLPFADVESKGRFFFSSKLMIGTTNQVNIKSDLDQVLAKPEAVLRRITHGYWLEVASEYMTERGTFNYLKFEREFNARKAALKTREHYTKDEFLSCVPWEAWMLRPCGFDGTPVQGVGPSVFSLVKQVASELRERVERHEETVDNLTDWLSMFPGASDAPIEPQAGSLSSGSDTAERAVSATELYMRALEPKDDDSEYEWRQEFDAAVDAWHADRRTMVQRIGDLFSQACMPVKKLFRSNTGRAVVASVALIAACTCALKAITAIWNAICGFVSSIKSLLIGEQDAIVSQSVHKEVTFPVKKRGEVVPSAIAQMGNPPSDALNDIIYRNTWKVFADGEIVGQVLMVRANIGVMPYHFRKGLVSASTIEMIGCSAKSLRLKFTGAQFASFEHHDLPQADLSFVDFCKVHAQAHRDVVRYAVTDREVGNDLSRGCDIPVRLDIARPYEYNNRIELERSVLVSRGLGFDRSITVGYNEVQQVWRYNMPTQLGDCGAPFTIAEPRYFQGHCLLGIHVAGRSRAPANGMQREGWAAVLTRELLEAQLGKFSKRPIVDRFVDSLQDKGVSFEETHDVVEQSGLADGSIAAIGVIAPECQISQSLKSKLKPTGFDGFGECPVRPAELRPVRRGDEAVFPMHKAMENYKTPLHNSFVPRAKAIMGLAMKRHWELTLSSTRRILSPEEAVVGVPHMKLKSVKRSSSCGYPYNLKYAKGKTEIFGDGDDFDLESQAAKAVLSDAAKVVEAAKNNERLAHVFVDFLKDETRPHAKVDAVATRAISGAPLDYSIAVKQYYGAFMSSVHMNHTRCGMAPGINHYTEWDILAKELLRPGGRVFAGDFKAFDASEQPEVHMLCLEYINSWYRAGGGTEEDDRVRTVLFQDLIHSRHLTGVGAMRDSLVQWNKSLPSGHPLTTIINSMYSLFTLTACYVTRTGDLTDMWDSVYVCTYGDDNVVGVSDAVSEVFNQVTVAEDMKDFGLTYTSDKKDGELKPFETIDDITFLKRSFARAECEGGWCGPLNMDSILFRTYWYHNNRNFARDLQQNLYDALLELSLHDASEWQHRYEAVLQFCKEMGFVCSVFSREQARELCFARTDVWY